MKGEPVVVVGVPLITTSFPETIEVTPAGKPETFTPVAPPPNVYVMVEIEAPKQTLCVFEPEANVRLGPPILIMILSVIVAEQELVADKVKVIELPLVALKGIV